MTPEERADALAQRVHDRLCNEIRGFLAIPDDVDEWIMPIVRGELSGLRSAITEAVEAERAARGRIAAMGLDDPLPCDVLVAPATLVRKGSPLLTLLTAIIRREGRAAEDTTFSRDTIEARGE